LSDSSPKSKNIGHEESAVTPLERYALLKQKPCTIWLTGLSASGKSTIARGLERALINLGKAAMILDGDNVRHGLSRDLGFSHEDREENIRRIAEIAKLFNDAGFIVITSFISPYKASREAAGEIIGKDRFLEMYVSTPLEVCEARDPKGLYEKVRAGEIPNFTGVTDPYEPPDSPCLYLPTQDLSVQECVKASLEIVLPVVSHASL